MVDRQHTGSGQSDGRCAAILAAAAGLREEIRGYQAEIEAKRRLPTPLVQRLRESGVYRLLAPRERGGAEAQLSTALHAIELLAEGDGAVGWNLTQTMVGQQFACGLSPEGADEIFAGGPDVLFSGTARPAGGRALAVKGGYVVSGTWSFGSGSAESDWMLQGCDVFDGEAPRVDGNGQPAHIRVFVPTADCNIQDTWHVSGLRGTGSNDWSIERVFVPACRSMPATLGAGWPGLTMPVSDPQQPDPDGRPAATGLVSDGTRLIAGSFFAAVALGLARAAIEEFTALAVSKQPRASRTLLREQPEVQSWLGRAEALVSSARAWSDAVAEESWRTVAGGATLSPEERARIRLCATQCVESCIEAVHPLYRAAGTTSLREENRLGRCWRDLQAVGQNFNVAPEFYAIAGRVALGLDPGPKLL